MSEPTQEVTAERACMEMNRIEELLATTKLNDMMHKKDDDQKTTVLQYIVSLLRIIWKTLKKILTMISTMISSVTKTKYSNIKKAAKAGIVKDSCLFYVRVYR